MAKTDRWHVVPPEQAVQQIARLRSLSALDPKLELTCRPLAVAAEGLLWQYIDVVVEPAGFGGRFATISVGGGQESALLAVTRLEDVWVWTVYLDGHQSSASGEEPDLLGSMRQCASALQGRFPRMAQAA
ncbi:MAG: hypothetical protein WCJ64_08825 [Rhodospirillaceae bacterium]